jgi:hypothetical protein
VIRIDANGCDMLEPLFHVPAVHRGWCAPVWEFAAW